MGVSLDTRRSRDDLRFVPARWLVVVLGASRLVWKGGKLGKFGIGGVLWSLLPRKLKLAAFGLVVAALIVVIGSLAAITLLAIQLS
jgi:hypothetical protein